MEYANGIKTRAFSTLRKPELTTSSTLAHFSQPNPEDKLMMSQQKRRTTTITSDIQRSSRMSINTPSTLLYSNLMRNTYKLVDKDIPTRHFSTKDIRNIIQNEFTIILTNKKYCPVESPKLAVVMSDRIKQKVMTLVLKNRYRVVTSVFLTNGKE